MTAKSPKQVYADFNNCDGEGRARLITMGSLSDLRQLDPLEEGEPLYLYDNELHVFGKAEFSEVENIWTGRFNWDDLAQDAP
jgi:hypothetical protein